MRITNSDNMLSGIASAYHLIFFVLGKSGGVFNIIQERITFPDGLPQIKSLVIPIPIYSSKDCRHFASSHEIKPCVLATVSQARIAGRLTGKMTSPDAVKPGLRVLSESACKLNNSQIDKPCFICIGNRAAEGGDVVRFNV